MAIFYFYFQLFCTRIILVTVLNRKNLSIMTDIWRKKKKGKTETIILVNLWKNVIIEKKMEQCSYLMVLFFQNSLLYWLNDVRWNWNNSAYPRDLPSLIASIESDSIFWAEMNRGRWKNKLLSFFSFFFLNSKIKGRKQGKQLMALKYHIIISRKPWPKDANFSQLTHCKGSLWSSCLS